ncbi:MAG: hypothetical protein WED34_07200 [Planctomycetales bacterium]
MPRIMGAYPERAVSFFFIRALASAVGDRRGDGHVVLEVGVANEPGKRFDRHFDALVFGDEIAFLAEFKQVWTPKNWLWLADDVDRVHHFADQVLNRFKNRESAEQPGPSRFFGFYGCDCWRSEVAAAWKTGDQFKRWTIPPAFLEMHRGSQTVWSVDGGRKKGTDFDGYYFLWAMEELPAPSSFGSVSGDSGSPTTPE